MATCAEGHCVTCSDEGIEMTVVAVGDDDARCRDPEGVDHEVQIDLVDAVAPGARLLVHAGVAIATLGGQP